jgi:hypothetical protein
MFQVLAMMEGWKRAPSDMQQKKARLAMKPQLKGHRDGKQ